MFAIDFGARSIKVAKLHKVSDGFELDSFGITLSLIVMELPSALKELSPMAKL